VIEIMRPVTAAPPGHGPHGRRYARGTGTQPGPGHRRAFGPPIRPPAPGHRTCARSPCALVPARPPAPASSVRRQVSRRADHRTRRGTGWSPGRATSPGTRPRPGLPERPAEEGTRPTRES